MIVLNCFSTNHTKQVRSEIHMYMINFIGVRRILVPGVHTIN